MGYSSACLVNRADVQWLLACGMGDSFSRILARVGFEHFDVDEFLFHPSVHTALGRHWATNLGACIDRWGAVYRVSSLLHTNGERQEEVRAGSSENHLQAGPCHFVFDGGGVCGGLFL